MPGWQPDSPARTCRSPPRRRVVASLSSWSPRRVRPEHQGSHPAQPGQADADHRGAGQRADAHAQRRRGPADSDLGPHGRRHRSPPGATITATRAGARSRPCQGRSARPGVSARVAVVDVSGEGHAGRSPTATGRSVTAALSGPGARGQLALRPRDRDRAARVAVGAERSDHRVRRQARGLRPGREGALRAARDRAWPPGRAVHAGARAA